jgi:hypothetical protein
MPGNYVFPGGSVEPEDIDPVPLKAHIDVPVGRMLSISKFCKTRSYLYPLSPLKNEIVLPATMDE